MHLTQKNTTFVNPSDSHAKSALKVGNPDSRQFLSVSLYPGPWASMWLTHTHTDCTSVGISQSSLHLHLPLCVCGLVSSLFGYHTHTHTHTYTVSSVESSGPWAGYPGQGWLNLTESWAGLTLRWRFKGLWARMSWEREICEDDGGGGGQMEELNRWGRVRDVNVSSITSHFSVVCRHLTP